MTREARQGAAQAGTGRWLALVWSGEGGGSVGRMLAAGAAVWLAYALLWLMLDGPVLDEAAVAAPVIAGDAGYPAGHPNAVVYRHAVLLSYRLAALQWLVGPDPWWISATRNVVFLWASAFVPFAVVVACTHRPAWGHVAAVLTLSETVCSAIGVYLMWVFPGVYSTGHFGIHAAVLAVTFTAARLDRLGGVLAGLMPALHATMTAVVWPAVAAVLVLRRLRGVAIGRVVASASVGLLAAALLGAVVRWHVAGDVVAPPYDVRGEGTAILRTLIRTTDPHRQPLPLWSPIGLLGPLAFAGLATAVLTAGRRLLPPSAGEGVVLVGALAWTWALGTRALQGVLPALPLPLAMTMPARFANLGMLLVVPLAVTALATRVPARTAALLALLLVAGEGVLLVAARQLAFLHLLYALLGVVAGALLGSAPAGTSRRCVAAAAGIFALASLAVRAADGSAVVGGFGAGFLAALALGVVVPPARRVGGALGASLAVGCLAVALLALRGPHLANRWDFGSERLAAEEVALGVWLDGNAAPHAMLLAPPFPPLWLQPKTGHPVLFDMITLLAMTYFPDRAEPTARLVRDVFAVDYADPAAIAALAGPDGLLRPDSPAWLRAWPGRTCAEWHALGARWGFAFVLAPRTTPLQLEAAWTGPTWTLYRMPPDAAACPAGAAS